VKALLVASSRAHGAALARWMKGFEPASWDIAVYGEPVTRRYAKAVLGRPTGDIIEDHHLWVSHVLRPLIVGAIEAFPGWEVALRRPLEITDNRGRSPDLSAMES
jgi:hypothetical protein